MRRARPGVCTGLWPCALAWLLNDPSIYSFIYSFIHSYVYSLVIQSSIHVFTYFIHPFVYSSHYYVFYLCGTVALAHALEARPADAY